MGPPWVAPVTRIIHHPASTYKFPRPAVRCAEAAMVPGASAPNLD